MPLIHLTTPIKAPIQTVFNLARSIDFHQQSATLTQEKAIAGRTSGLIELGETVTWQAIHFGVKQQLTTQITAMNAPHSFRDEMIQGIFKSIKHEHFFYRETYLKSEINPVKTEVEEQSVTMMVDLFRFEAPLGLLGKLAGSLFLKRYMTHFLLVRNEAIKKEAEKLAAGN